MTYLSVSKVKIAGMSAGVPAHILNNDLGVFFSKEEDIALFEKSTGIKKRHLDTNFTTSDLSIPAVESELTPETNFRELDDWTSLTMLSIIEMIEEEFGVSVGDFDLRMINSIGSLYSLVQKHIENNN